MLVTFGMYSGKVLETITHEEKPWAVAMGGYLPAEPSYCEIAENLLEVYFEEKNAQYKLATVDGMKRYIKTC